MCDEIQPDELRALQTSIRRDFLQGEQQLVLFRRQYLQKLDIKHISFPPLELLQLYDIQRWIYRFVRDPPADEYRPKSDHDILNELVKRIEQAVKDAKEPDIFDPLVELAAELCTQPRLAMTEAAQRDVWVSYEGPWLADMLDDDRSIKLLEKPRLLAATGFTGYRTWEAAVALASHIATDWLPQGKLAGKRILELGAGTGLISFLCAKEGDVKSVVATDGAQDAIERLEYAGEVNKVQDDGKISYGQYYWGESFEGTMIGETFDARQMFDIVFGADITYDPDAGPSLVTTLVNLLAVNPRTLVVISVTFRNPATFHSFLRLCNENELNTNVTELVLPPFEQQNGIFSISNDKFMIVTITSSAIIK